MLVDFFTFLYFSSVLFVSIFIVRRIYMDFHKIQKFPLHFFQIMPANLRRTNLCLSRQNTPPGQSFPQNHRTALGLLLYDVCFRSFQAAAPYVYLYNGPNALQASRSAASRSLVPNAVHTCGRKISSSGTLCMVTGIRSMEARVIRSAPTWP